MGRKLLIASALLVALMFLPAPLYPLWLARFVVREAALLPAILAGWALLRIRRESPPAPRRTGACVGAALLIVASLLPVLAPLPLCLRHGVTPSLWQYLTGAPSLSIPVERNVTLASDRPDLLVDVYRTAKPGADLRPAVIVLHSGSFHFGDKGEAPAVSRQLAAAGYVVFDLRYRLAPTDRFPAAVQDIKCILGRLAEPAQRTRFAIDPARIALLGRSAGGSLALTAGYAAQAAGPDLPAIPPSCAVAEIAPRAIVAIYPWGDLRAAYEHPPRPDPLGTPTLFRSYIGGTPQELPAAYAHASPGIYIRHRPPRSLPATLLVHGLADGLVDAQNSRAVAAALRTAGYAPQHVEIPLSEHGFDQRPGGVGEQLARTLIVQFLDQALAPAR